MFSKQKLFGMILAFLATASWASSYVVSRFVFGESKIEVDPIFATFLRVAMGAVFFIFLLLFTNKLKDAQKAFSKNIWIFIFLGLFGVAMENVLVFWSTKYTTAARSSLCANLSPVFTVLMAWMFMGEKMNRYKIIGMLLGFSGITIAILGNGSQDIYTNSTSIIGDMMAIGAGICWAAYTAGGIGIVKRYGSAVSVTLIFVIGTIILFLIIIFTGRPMQWEMPLKMWFAYIYLGIFANGIAYLFWYTALKYLKAGEIGAFGYISVMLTVVFSCIFLKEQIGIPFIIALVCVMSGVYLMMEKKEKDIIPATMEAS